MSKFFSAYGGTIITLAVLIAVVAFITVYLLKRKRKTGCSGFCSDCGGCSCGGMCNSSADGKEKDDSVKK